MAKKQAQWFCEFWDKGGGGDFPLPSSSDAEAVRDVRRLLRLHGWLRRVNVNAVRSKGLTLATFKRGKLQRAVTVGPMAADSI